MNPYQKLLSRKRKWTPVQTEAGQVKEGAKEAIYRALAMRHMELPVEILSPMLWPLTFQKWHGSYCYPTSKTKKTTTWLCLTSPMLTALTRKLRRRRWHSERLGLRILITRSLKQWLPSVQFSSFYYPSFALMVTLECERYRRTSVVTNRFTSLPTPSYARSWAWKPPLR